MPVGELMDLIDIYKIYSGSAEEVTRGIKEAQNGYIPKLR